MKKLLGSVFALTLGVTCATAVFVGCNNDKVDGDSDAEIAANAISYVKSMYDKTSLYETNDSYDVIKHYSYNAVVYDIDWTLSSVSATSNDINDYLTIVDSAEDDLKKTVSVNERPEEDIEYYLTASVTVGNETASHSIKRNLVGIGTIITPTEVNELAKSLKSGDYYKEGGVVKKLVVGGYVIDPGTYNASASRYDQIYIADEYTRTLDKKAADVLYVYRVATDSKLLTGYGSLEKGDYAVFSGYLQNYNGTIELTYNGSNNAQCVKLEKSQITDEQKVEAALDTLALSRTKFSEVEEITLPATSCGTNVSWAVTTTTDLVTITGNTLKVVKIPEATQNVTITATISCGSVAPVTKEITITVAPPVVLEHAGTEDDPLSVADVQALFATLASGEFYQVGGVDKQFYIEGYVTVVGTLNGSYGLANVYIADTAGDTDNDILIYNLNWGAVPPMGSNPLALGDKIVITGYLKNHYGTYEVAQSGTNYPAFVKWESSLTDEEKVAKALENVPETFTVTKEGATPLPLASYGVLFIWSAEDAKYKDMVSDGVVTVIELPTEDYSFQATVAASYNNVKQTKTITVIVKAPALDGFVPITAPVAGEYYMAMDINGTWYYMTGALSGNYAASTTNVAEAAKIELVADGDGWLLKANGKYIEITSDSNKNIKFNDTRTSDIHWVWNAEHSIFTWTNDNGTLWLGTYSTYTTFSASYISYITNNNQYPAKLGKYNGEIGGGDVTPGEGTSASYDYSAQGYTNTQSLDGVVVKAGDVSIVFNKATGTTAPAYYDTGTAARAYHGNTVTVSVPQGYKILKITFNSTALDGNVFSVNVGSLTDLIWTGSAESVVFTAGPKKDGSNGGHIRVTSITIEYTVVEGAHIHEWSYAHVEGKFQHTRTCSADGCDIVSETVDCVPVLNACPDCKHEYSETEILNALFALELGAYLPGTYSLTGVVKTITDAWSSSFGNITFIITIGDKELTVYRAKNDAANSTTYAQNVKVGDTVTVTGALTYYNSNGGTYEFTSGCLVVALVPGEGTGDSGNQGGNQGGDDVTPGETASLSFANEANRTEGTTNSSAGIQVWEQNGIKFTNTGNVNIQYFNPVRIYANSTVKVEYTGMKEIVFHCNSASYANVAKEGLENAGYTVTVDGNDVTVVLAEASNSIEFTVAAQTRFDSIEVKGESATTPGGDSGNQGGNTEGGDVTPVAGASIELKGKGSNNATANVWSDNGITVTLEKNTSSTAPNNYDGTDHIRMYGGQKMTVEYTGMTEAVFTCKSESYATTLAGYLTAAGYTAVANGSDVTVTGVSGSIVFTNTASSGNVQICSITVK